MKTALLFLASLLFTLSVQAQTNVRAWYAKGQTWVVWDTGGQQASTWDVYRGSNAFTGIGQGTLTGRLFIKEAQGEKLKLSGNSLTWVAPLPGGGTYTLAASEGLFAYTPHAAATEFFAVVRRGQTAVTATNRTAAAVAQGYDPVNDPIICHRQANLTNNAGYAYSVWAMWSDGRDNANDARPDFPITANFAKNGAPHVFAVYEPTGGPVAGPMPAAMILHGGGPSDIGYTKFQPGVTGGDIGIIIPCGLLIAPDDGVYRVTSITPTFSVDAITTLWLGYRTNWDPFSVWPANQLPPADSTIVNYTMRRLDWMMDWLINRSPWNVDAKRFTIMGGSMGGGGASLLARWKPERFNSAVPFVARMVAPTTNDVSSASGNGIEILGTGDQNLPTNLAKAGGGTFGINEVWRPWLNLSATQRDLPLMRFYLGRNDTENPWGPGKINIYQNINAAAWGAHLFWDSRVHGNQYWSSGNPPGQYIAEWVAPVQTAYASAPYQARYRNDQSFPAFFNDDQNAVLAGRQPNMGNGDPANGDTVGTWSGYYDWDQSNLTDTAIYWACTIFLTGLSSVSVDNYPGTSATASIAIRRPQLFLPSNGASLAWRLRRVSDGVVLQSGTTTPDTNSLVSINNLTIFKDPVRTRLEVYPASQPPALGLGTSADVVSTTVAQLAQLTVPTSGANAGQPQITVSGLIGLNLVAEYSDDLATWQPLVTFALTTGGVLIADPSAAGMPRRFYRLRLP
jgi:hypothetical protein